MPIPKEIDLSLENSDQRTPYHILMSGRTKFKAYRLANRAGVPMCDLIEAAIAMLSKPEHAAELERALGVIRKERIERRTKKRALMKGLSMVTPTQLAILEHVVGLQANDGKKPSPLA